MLRYTRNSYSCAGSGDSLSPPHTHDNARKADLPPKDEDGRKETTMLAVSPSSSGKTFAGGLVAGRLLEEVEPGEMPCSRVSGVLDRARPELADAAALMPIEASELQTLGQTNRNE